jgi:PP-loop superfamily ATP-utilizing enzyme
MSARIAEGVKAAGFATVTLDPEGYRQGSLNALLKLK